jgi:hypothetical protein
MAPKARRNLHFKRKHLICRQKAYALIGGIIEGTIAL